MCSSAVEVVVSRKCSKLRRCLDANAKCVRVVVAASSDRFECPPNALVCGLRLSVYRNVANDANRFSEDEFPTLDPLLGRTIDFSFLLQQVLKHLRERRVLRDPIW